MLKLLGLYISGLKADFGIQHGIIKSNLQSIDIAKAQCSRFSVLIQVFVYISRTAFVYARNFVVIKWVKRVVKVNIGKLMHIIY